MTVLFINLENMQDVLQDAVKTQKYSYRYKCSLNKFLFDDKGRTLIAVFGLPPIANFGDCTRAVLAALFFEQKMRSLRIKARIGVTTGRVCTVHRRGGRDRLGERVQIPGRPGEPGGAPHAARHQEELGGRARWRGRGGVGHGVRAGQGVQQH